MNTAYRDQNRTGDHIWYVSDTRKFQSHYPQWQYTYDLRRIVEEIVRSMTRRVGASTSRTSC